MTGIVVAATELTTDADADALIAAIGEGVMRNRSLRDEPLYFERNPERQRRQGFRPSRADRTPVRRFAESAR